MDSGRVAVEGGPDELKAELRGDAVHVELREKPVALVVASMLLGTVFSALSNVFGMTLRQRESIIG